MKPRSIFSALVLFIVLWSLGDTLPVHTQVIDDYTHYQELMHKQYDRAREKYASGSPQHHSTAQDTGFTVLGRWAWGSCEALDVQGNYAYIGNGATFHVLDVSNPSSPTIVGEYVTDGYVSDVRLRDTLAFVASVKLLIMNVSNPTAPELVSELNIPGIAFRVFPADSFLYVTTLGGAMFVVDISNPTLPRLRGGIAAGGNYVRSVAARERYVYVGNQEEWDLTIIDARNPDSLSRTFLGISGFVLGVSVQDSILLVGANGTFKLYNVSTPASPVYLGGINLGDWILGITPAGLMAYVITSDSGVYAIDISNLAQPQIRSRMRRTIQTQFGVYNSVLTGQNMFVPFSTGMLVVNASTPDSLRSLAFFPTGGSAVRVALKDSLVYVASGLAGLWILDISNPEHPRSVSNVNTGGTATDVLVADSFAYVVNYPIRSGEDSSRGLWIIDVSNILQPRIVSHYIGIVRFSGTVVLNTIAKLGGLIFMSQSPTAGNDTVVEVVDVTAPGQPTHLSTIRGTYRPYDVAVRDSILYVAASDSGLLIFDIHDPTSPRRLFQFGSLGSYPYWGVSVTDSYAYVDRIDTFFVLELSNPSLPTVIGKWGRNYGSFSNIDLSVAYPFVYWAEGSLGAIDISDPTRPVERSRFSGYDWLSGVAAIGSTVVAADASQGVWILRNDLVTAVEDQRWHSLPQSFELHQNYPNPFNPSTTITYDLSKESHVRLSVFNTLGQELRVVFEGQQFPGRHSHSFETKELSSGVYYYQLVTEGYRSTRKMLLVK